ncbi:hypothetical protein OAU50_08310 [Planctomycetota bacterium]|nr:hypothetical protein [Planctomycetota bacterium]
MKRILSMLAVTACCTAVAAQSFPHLEITKVRRAVGAAESATSKTPNPGVKTPEVIKPEDVDGAKVKVLYDELLTAYMKDKKDQVSLYEVETKDIVDPFRDYLESLNLLRLGFYKDAAKGFEDVGYEVKNYDDLNGQIQTNMADEIMGGKAYYYQVVAVVMEEYETFESIDELESGWKKADREAGKIIKDLKKVIKRKKIDATIGDRLVIDIQNWLLEEKSSWRVMWSAEMACQKYPENFSSWQSLVNCTGSKRSARLKESTPAYLKQRAAIEVIKKFWVTNAWVMDGSADQTLALNFAGCLQIEDADAALEEQPYHTRDGKKKLRFVANSMRTVKAILKKLRE